MKEYNNFNEVRMDTTLCCVLPREIKIKNDVFILHHTILANGYQNGFFNKVEEYQGRFGTGFILSTWSCRGRKHNKTYYVKEGFENESNSFI